MELKELLKDLTVASGISGYETQAAEVAKKHLSAYSDEVRIDKIGRVWLFLLDGLFSYKCILENILCLGSSYSHEAIETVLPHI